MLEDPVVILTREPEDNFQLSVFLKHQNIQVVEYPCIATKILYYNGDKIDGDHSLEDFRIIVFTSKRGVLGMNRYYDWIRKTPQIIAVVGEKTGSVLLEKTGREADLTANPENSRTLAENIVEKFKSSDPVLHIRGNKTSGIFEKILKQNGFYMSHLTVYKNESPRNTPLVLEKNAIVCFASPSAVSCYFKHNPSHHSLVHAVAIGPVTASHLKSLGIEHIHETSGTDITSIARTIRNLIKGGQ